MADRTDATSIELLGLRFQTSLSSCYDKWRWRRLTDFSRSAIIIAKRMSPKTAWQDSSEKNKTSCKHWALRPMRHHDLVCLFNGASTQKDIKVYPSTGSYRFCLKPGRLNLFIFSIKIIYSSGWMQSEVMPMKRCLTFARSEKTAAEMYGRHCRPISVTNHFQYRFRI